MKKLYLLPVLFIISLFSYAQSPGGFKYQAIVRDSVGDVIANQTVFFRISLLEGNISGPEKYIEAHEIVTSPRGLANLSIGLGNVETGNLSGLLWGDSAYFLKTEIDLVGDSSFTYMGTSQILSVPLAMYAFETGDTSRWNKDTTSLYYNRGNVGIGTRTPQNHLHLAAEDRPVGMRISIQDTIGNTWFLGVDTTGNLSGLTIRSDSSLNAADLYISKSGYVGIGTDMPQHALDVSGDIFTSQGIFFSDSTYVNSAQSFWSISDNCTYRQNGNVVIGNSGCSQYKLSVDPIETGLGLAINNIPSLNESGAMNIQYQGGSIRQLGYMNMQDTAQYGYGMRLGHDVESDTLDNWAGIYVDYAFPDSNRYAAIFKSGNVGIGTDYPSQALHVEGKSYFEGNLGINKENPDYALDIGGNVRFGDYLFGDTTTAFNKMIIRGSEHPLASKIEFGKGMTDQSKSLKLLAESGGQIQFFTDNKIRVQVRDSVVVIGRPVVDKYVDLNVNGKIQAQEVEVYIGQWWDQVFKPGYKLPTLEEVESYIAEHNHLPGMPAEAEVLEQGVNLGEMDGLLLKKIEELTLYMIELHKENKQLALEIEKLKN